MMSALAVALACSFGCADGGSVAGAATAASVGVATAGINRAVTKDCWARCSKGYVCNQESGLCEKGECIPSCAPGAVCTRTTKGNTCLAQGTPVPYPLSDPTRADRLGPRGVRGDTLAPETPAEKNTRSGLHSEGGQVQLPPGDPGPPAPVETATGDDVHRASQEEYRERGASILPQLDKLVLNWRPRLVPQEQFEFAIAVGPPRRPLSDYMQAVHATRVHDVYSRGFLGSLGDLSPTHALSNQELSVTIGLVIDAKTGHLDSLSLLESSGSELFDVGTLEAINRAAPFPTPPEELRQGKGKLYLKWQLFRDEVYACSAYFLTRLVPKAQ